MGRDTGNPMAGRLLVCVGEDPRSLRLRDRLRELPGLVGAGAVSPLRAAGPLLANFETGGGEAGLSALVDRGDFVAALRGLTDSAYWSLLKARDGQRAVDLIPRPVSQVAPWLRLLYPDAVLVAPSGLEPEADLHVDDTDVEAAMDTMAGLPPPSIEGCNPGGAPRFDDRDLIVVLGAGRSGTTWLHRLLTAHPDVTGTANGETWLFAGVSSYWNAAQDVQGLGAWLDPAEAWNAMRRFADALLSAGRTRLDPRSRLLCEKTPAHVWQLPLICRLYPGAAFIHLVRDGRDVALSMSRVADLDIDPVEAARRWSAAIRAVTGAQPAPARLMTVRYEDLLDDPVELSEEMLRWVGVEADDRFRADARRRAQERVSPLGSRGPVGAGKWRELPRRTVEAMEAVAGEELTALGYR